MTTLCKPPDEDVLLAIGAEVDINKDGTYYIMLPYNIADVHKEVCMLGSIVHLILKSDLRFEDFSALLFSCI